MLVEVMSHCLKVAAANEIGCDVAERRSVLCLSIHLHCVALLDETDSDMRLTGLIDGKDGEHCHLLVLHTAPTFSI